MLSHLAFELYFIHSRGGMILIKCIKFDLENIYLKIYV